MQKKEKNIFNLVEIFSSSWSQFIIFVSFCMDFHCVGIEHAQRTNLSNKYIKHLASGFIQPHNFPEFIKF